MAVVGELITLFIMATALGMDAFSVALGMGMIGLRNRQIFNIGIVIGLFHILMPLLGMLTGQLLSNYFGSIATIIGGALLLILGLQMVYGSLSSEDEATVKPIGVGLFIFAISVSIDSFSAGLSLGILGAKVIIAILAFGLMSMFLSWLGLIMGSKFKGYIGAYGELLGGVILIAFGVKLLLP